MATMFNKRGKFFIEYNLNGKRRGYCTGLLYEDKNLKQANRFLAQAAKKEKENKLRIKYGNVPTVIKKSNKTISDVLSEFRSTMKVKTDKKNYHSVTLEVAMRQFTKVIDENTEISKVTESDISMFISDVLSRAKRVTVRTYLRYLKAVFSYAVEKKYIEVTPIHKRLIPRDEARKIIIFKRVHLAKILEKAKARDQEYYRIYKMLLLTALRPVDIFRLRCGDFDLDKKVLYTTLSKTSSEWVFPIYAELRDFLEAEYPGLRQMDKDEILFKKYGVERIGKTFRKITKELGLDKEGYSLKTFRKTTASILGDKGLPEGDLADLLGHTSFNTTRQYYRKKNAALIGQRIDGLGGLEFY
jgi:integrase